MRRIAIRMLTVLLALLTGAAALAETEKITYRNVSVHDPSVLYADGVYYLYGSHMTAAKSTDLINWTLISKNASNEGCTLFENVQTELSEALSWARTDTFWAPDVCRLDDGRYYYYYCCCVGNAPLSALGAAVSDSPEGPYRDLGMIVKSGYPGFDATVYPNAIDPCVFFDKEHKLWMVYGSYSGGIYILQMNPETGFPLEGQEKFGKKLLGGYHSQIEGPYILYSPDTEYYYLFLSYGGLNANDGYNIRVCRSQSPDGPYTDAAGNDMLNCRGDHALIARYGAKLLGGYLFTPLAGEKSRIKTAYRSPGHNSALYDAQTGKYYIFFHTRFAGAGETFSVRVHEFYMNRDGWPVVSPMRYSGDSPVPLTEDRLAGVYKIVCHGRDVNRVEHASVCISLNPDGTVAGEWSGTWAYGDDFSATLTIDGVSYTGVFRMGYDARQNAWMPCGTAMSPDGACVWLVQSTLDS